MTKTTWTNADKDVIIKLLVTNDIFLERAIIQLFLRQTQVEIAENTAKNTNFRGFNKPDARKMTIYAKVCLKGTNQVKGEGNRLDPWMKDDAKRRVVKYWRQLIQIANEKAVKKVQLHMGV